MSPERVECQKYNSNCDIWSFGLVLYELATGKDLPYRTLTSTNESMYLLMQKIKNLPVPAFEETDGRSKELCHFLSRW
jgi:serine/threonine protein kinase